MLCETIRRKEGGEEMRVFLFLRGGYSKNRFYGEHFSKTGAEDDVVMCADGGYALAKALGIMPHYVIGDLDSLAREELKETGAGGGGSEKTPGVPGAGDEKNSASEREPDIHAQKKPAVFSFPEDKDFSDFELSLQKALELGPERVFVYGALGGRKDHELINVLVLAHAPTPVVFCEHDVEIYNVTDDLHLRERAGLVCSLLTFSASCAIEEMRGFQYLLSHEKLFPSSRGLSNRIVDDYAYIKKRSGTLVVVVNLF